MSVPEVHRLGGSAGRSKPPIAYIMSRFPKLTETFILYEILAVERLGRRVEIYPLLREREPTMHPEAYPLVEGAHYQPFLSRAILGSNVRMLVRRPSAYLGALAGLMHGTFGSRNYFFGGLAIFPKVTHIARLLEASGVAHVHCHFANHPAAAGWIINRLTGIPFSFTAHGSDLHVDRHMLDRKVAAAAFVVAISDDNREEIVQECGAWARERVSVIHCGVDTTVFHPPEGPPEPGRPLTIRCIGTLHEVKGQNHLVDACRLLVESGIEVHCHLVGDGPDEPALRRRIEEAGLVGRVFLDGRRTRAEIVELLAQTDVLVAPSVPTKQGKREGIPVVLMEAMACSVAVVASDLSGIPELVRHERNGLLVRPGDPAQLAVAIRRLHDEPQLRQRLGTAARADIMRDFDLVTNAAALLARIEGETRWTGRLPSAGRSDVEATAERIVVR